MTRPALTPTRFAVHVGAGVFILVVLIALSPGIGSQPIGVIDAFESLSDRRSQTYYIAFDLRMARSIRALIAGFTLALSGAVFQTLFRNVLATPYTLGIASGGSLGALLAIKFGLGAHILLGFSGVQWFAFAGCAAVVAVVLLIAGARSRGSGNSLILAGVTIGLFCSAMMMFVTYLADVRETFSIVRWMMGTLEAVGHTRTARILIPLIAAWTAMLWCARGLNQFQLGDEIAASRGVHPVRLQWAAVSAASLATACIVAICGPIGFVGLIVPHAARSRVGRDHRILLPVAALWGAIFLILCDWLTRLLPVWWGTLIGRELTAAPLHIGVMTAVIGAPTFLIVLLRGRSV